MAKCVQCGKKGLFLRLDPDGLCADCVLKREIREMHERNMQKTWEERLARIKADQRMIPRGYVMAVDRVLISQDEIVSPYDLSAITKVDNIYYLVGEADRGIALRDISTVNEFIKAAHKLVPEFPGDVFDTGRVQFDMIYPRAYEYVFLTFAHKTPSGKPPKYPVVLNWSQDYIMRLEISYTQDKEIGKIEYSQAGATNYKLNVARIAGELAVNLIYRTNMRDGVRVKLYDRKING